MSAEQGGDAFDSPSEDGAEPPSVERSQNNLLDRLLYKGVLPGYAFPTDVVSFHVFDESSSDRFRTEYLYAPSQGLPVALSQYAPGKVVWIDNKEWTSGALYSPFRRDLTEAWRERWRYFECSLCHYALHVTQDEAERGEQRQCPACGTPDSFGAAMNWMRPPGFAHRVKEQPGTSPDDSPARSYATRAKLSAEGPADASQWEQLAPHLQQTYRRDTLLVTNTGPMGAGYNYCTFCGLIEPTQGGSRIVNGPHKKPYHDDRDETCPGTRTTQGLVLGTDFITDVLLIRLKADEPINLRPEFLSTQIVLRTLADALAIEAAERLDLERTEILAEYRPALTQRGNDGLEAEIYLYDTLPGGAGFTRRVSELGDSLYTGTLTRLEQCPEDCETSCYRCLRSFGNRFEHALLNRQLGSRFLRYLLHGDLPTVDNTRMERSAALLAADLRGRGVEGLEESVVVDIENVGPVLAPILVTKGKKRWIVGVYSPLTPNHTSDPTLAAAIKSASVPVHLLDELVIRNNLPFASQQVLNWLA